MTDKDDTTRGQSPEFDRFADVARKVFAAPKEEVELRIARATQRRKNKRAKKKAS